MGVIREAAKQQPTLDLTRRSVVEHYIVIPNEPMVFDEGVACWPGVAACGAEINLRIVPPEGTPRCPVCTHKVESGEVD
jgi:hypothetical protein